MKHKHLTYDDRLIIQQELENNYSLHKIAQRLHKSDSTIARDERLLATLCRILSQLIAQVPVYHLACRPDAEAARLACRTIFGSLPDK